jgi:hypothetical protein
MYANGEMIMASMSDISDQPVSCFMTNVMEIVDDI